MDPTIVVAIITSVSSLLTGTIFYFIIHLFLNKLEGKIQKDLARLDPSFLPYFKENRDYLRLLRKIKYDFIEFYFHKPRKRIFQVNSLERFVDDPTHEFRELYLISDEILKWFGSLLKEHNKYYSIYYAHLNLGDLHEFNSKTGKQFISFFDEVPLINPKIKELGEEFTEFITKFSYSDDLKTFLISLDNKELDTMGVFELLTTFENDIVKLLDSKIQSIENYFLVQYVDKLK